MEQIAVAAAIVQPATDTKLTGGASPAQGGGLFKALMAWEIANGSAKIDGQSTKQTKLPCGLAAIWLMAVLSARGASPAAQGADGQGGEAVAGIQPADPQPDSPPDAQSLAGLGGAAQLLMQLVGANPQAAAVLQQFMRTGQPDAGQAVEALSAALTGGGGANEAKLPTSLTAKQKQDLAALLEALAPAGGDTHAAGPEQGNGAALKEIRRLFAELVAAEGQETTTQVPQKAVQAVATPVQAVATPVQAVATPMQAGATPVQDAPPEAPRGRTERLIPTAGQLQSATAGQRATQGGKGPDEAKTCATTGPASVAPEPKKQQSAAVYAAFRPMQAVTQTAAPAAPDRAQAVQAAQPGAEAFDSIVQSISGMKDASAREMQIQLKPEFLGKVVISLSMGEGGLVAKIAAANPRVQDAFLTQAAALQSALADQGLKDVRVVVTSASVQDPNLQQQADRRGQGQYQQQKRNRYAIDAVEQQGGRVAQAYESAMRPGAINYLA